MHTNIKLEEQELVYRIAGCAMEVLNEIGHGLLEKTYERALAGSLISKESNIRNRRFSRLNTKGK